MALEQGIDTQVQDKMDAYRSNPQQLMKMYQTNKQLVDLLALQKLKSEKEAAARDIQMQMQQQPGTIKQQREQELMQMTKDELAKQTQGVLQQKQRKQQSNLQRMAKGKSGLGALAQNQPTPVQTQTPKSMLAGGGIVAFQEGGSAFGDSAAGLGGYADAVMGRGKDVGTAIKQYYADFGITNQDEWNRTPAEAKKRIASAVKAKVIASAGVAATAIPFAELNDMLLDPFKALSNLGIAASNTGLGAAMGLSDPNNPNEPYQYNTNRKRVQDTLLTNKPIGSVFTRPTNLPEGSAQKIPKDPDAFPVLNSSSPTNVTNSQAKLLAKILSYPDATPVMPTDSSGGDPTGFNMKTGIAALNVPPSDNVAVDTSMTDVDNQIAGLNAVSGGNMGGAEDALKRGVGIGEDVLGRGDKAAKYAGLEADLAAFDEATYDPEEDRRRQLQAFLIGSAGKTSVGTTLAGGAAAALNEESRQKINSRARMIDRINLSKDAMTSDTDLGKSALSLGNQMFADYNANQRTAMSAAATLGAAKLRAVTDRAKLDFERDKEENTQEYRLKDLKIREANSAIEQARNEQLDLDRRLRGNLTATAKLLEIIQQENENAAKLFGVEDATAQLQFLTPDDEGYEAAKAARNTAVAEANAYAAQRLEEDKVYTQLKTLFGLYFELTGVQDIPGINVDDITKIEPKR